MPMICRLAFISIIHQTIQKVKTFHSKEEVSFFALSVLQVGKHKLP